MKKRLGFLSVIVFGALLAITGCNKKTDDGSTKMVYYSLVDNEKNTAAGKIEASSKIKSGDTLTLKATASSGYYFVGWDIDGDGRLDTDADSENTKITRTVDEDFLSRLAKDLNDEGQETGKYKINALFAKGVVYTGTVNGYTVKVVNGKITTNSSSFTLKPVDENNFAYWYQGSNSGVALSYSSNYVISNAEISSNTTYNAQSGVYGYVFATFGTAENKYANASLDNIKSSQNIDGELTLNQLETYLRGSTGTDPDVYNNSIDYYLFTPGARGVDDTNYSVVVNESEKVTNSLIKIYVYLNKDASVYSYFRIYKAVDGAGSSVIISTDQGRNTSKELSFNDGIYTYKILVQFAS